MSGPIEDDDEAMDATGWSLLYAPESSLHPVACAGCGNVFGAESSTCPWCGRAVTGPPRVAAEAIPVAEAPRATLALAPAPSPASDHADDDDDDDAVDGRRPAAAGDDAGTEDASAAPDDDRPARVRHRGARPWAGAAVAAGVLVSIATGVAVRGKDTAKTSAAAPTTGRTGAPTSATRSPTAATPTTSSRAASAPTTAAAPAATTAAPATTAAAPTAASTIPATTTGGPGPSLSERERSALAVTQQLTDAIVGHNWPRVRALAPNNTTTDASYDRYWGTIESAALVPTRVTANPDGTFAVYTGVLNVTNPTTGRVTTLACGRYVVDLKVEQVVAVKTRDLRSIPGVTTVNAVGDELRKTCSDPGF